MGTRTEILKIATDVRTLASKNPSIARDLQLIAGELEAAAERADKKRLEKKNAVKELLTTLDRPAAPSQATAPKPNFLSTVVLPRMTDPTLRMQLAEYEKTLTNYFQLISNLQKERASVTASIARNLR